MPIPDFQSLMRPLLECAKNADEVRTSECVDFIADKLQISQDEREEMLPSGRQPILLNRIHWARTYLGKANVIESTKRGHFRIKERGLKLLANGPDRITMNTLQQFDEYNNWREITSQSNQEPTPVEQSSYEEISPEERIEKTHAELNDQLKQDILTSLYEVTPTTFEHIIIDLLLAVGYGEGRTEMGRALGKTGDGGVDGVIKEDELGLDVVYIQAKSINLIPLLADQIFKLS